MPSKTIKEELITKEKQITKEKFLVVEGNDEVNFFKHLLKHMKINVENIHIENIEGKDKFKKSLPALMKRRGFSKVKVFAIIRDADDDSTAAFHSIKNIIKKEIFSVPQKPEKWSKNEPFVGIFIMPGNREKGMLEDLCLKTVSKHPAMPCVKNFINCIKKLPEPPKNLTKSKAQVFLASMPKIVNSIGIGATRGYWNFNSKAKLLVNLKKFLERFR